MDQDDESSNCSSSTTSTPHRPKRMAAVLSGHAPEAFSQFQSSKLSESEALELAILTSLEENRRKGRGNLTNIAPSRRLSNYSRSNTQDSSSEEDEDMANVSRRDKETKPKSTKAYAKTNGKPTTNGHTNEPNKSKYSQTNGKAKNVITKIQKNKDKGEKSESDDNDSSSEKKTEPTVKPRPGSGRLAGPPNPQKHIRYSAARKYPSNDARSTNVDSAQTSTKPSSKTIDPSSSNSATSSSAYVKVPTKENRSRIEKSFKNFSLFPNMAINAHDFVTFLLCTDPAMLFTGKEVVANFPRRMPAEDFERKFKADQAKIRDLEARGSGESEEDDDEKKDGEEGGEDDDEDTELSNGISKKGMVNGKSPANGHRAKNQKGAKRSKVTLNEYDSSSHSSSSSSSSESDDDQSKSDDSSSSSESSDFSASKRETSVAQKLGRQRKKRRKIVLKTRRSPPPKRTKTSNGSSSTNYQARSRTKPSWPAKRPRLSLNGTESSGGENSSSGNTRPQRKNRPLSFLGADEDLQVKQAIAASLKDIEVQQQQTSSSSSSTNRKGTSLERRPSSASVSSEGGKQSKVHSKKPSSTSTTSERELVHRRANEAFESSAREKLIRAEQEHFPKPSTTPSTSGVALNSFSNQQKTPRPAQYVQINRGSESSSSSSTKSSGRVFVSLPPKPLKPPPAPPKSVFSSNYRSEAPRDISDSELDPPTPEPEVITIDDDDDDDEVLALPTPPKATTSGGVPNVLNKLKNINAERKSVKERMKSSSAASTLTAISGGLNTSTSGTSAEPVRTRSSDRKTRNSKQQYERRTQETLSGHGQFDGSVEPSQPSTSACKLPSTPTSSSSTSSMAVDQVALALETTSISSTSSVASSSSSSYKSASTSAEGLGNDLSGSSSLTYKARESLVL